tara:strand:+ start:366 stop:1160 length:795 start_codon:yes stop_codon:yes gene_type:complete
VVFFCSNKVYGAFDSESLSSFQNAAGAFPFSIYPNSLGALSDPTILFINRSPFGAGSINRKFGLRSLMESLFVVGGNFRNLGLGLGLSRFGNSTYQETQISILGAKSYKELVQLGISLNMYQLSISHYGQAQTIGSKVSVRYAMGTHVETMISLLNVNRPVIGQSKEKLPQIISAGILVRPNDKIIGQASFVQDTEFPISVRFGMIYKLLDQIDIAVGKIQQPNIFTTGGCINWKEFRIEFSCLSYTNLGFITYQTGISYTHIP